MSSRPPTLSQVLTQWRGRILVPPPGPERTWEAAPLRPCPRPPLPPPLRISHQSPPSSHGSASHFPVETPGETRLRQAARANRRENHERTERKVIKQREWFTSFRELQNKTSTSAAVTVRHRKRDGSISTSICLIFRVQMIKIWKTV